jgi:hypothetical protein
MQECRLEIVRGPQGPKGRAKMQYKGKGKDSLLLLAYANEEYSGRRITIVFPEIETAQETRETAQETRETAQEETQEEGLSQEKIQQLVARALAQWRVSPKGGKGKGKQP